MLCLVKNLGITIIGSNNYITKCEKQQERWFSKLLLIYFVYQFKITIIKLCLIFLFRIIFYDKSLIFRGREYLRPNLLGLAWKGCLYGYYLSSRISWLSFFSWACSSADKIHFVRFHPIRRQCKGVCVLSEVWGYTWARLDDDYCFW